MTKIIIFVTLVLISASSFANESVVLQFFSKCQITDQEEINAFNDYLNKGYDLVGVINEDRHGVYCSYTLQQTNSIPSKPLAMKQHQVYCQLSWNKDDRELIYGAIEKGYRIVAISKSNVEKECVYTLLD